jgi:23S rRNA (cytosine1962-C5)-methyltransferase
MEACKHHVQLNGYPVEEHGFFAEDMFDFLGSCTQEYDLVILDPPAFAKKKAHLPLAIKAYKKLVEMGMRRLAPSGILMVSSCSYYLTEEALEMAVRESAHRLHKQIRLLGRHRLADDHPINLFHPESSYLKSLVVRL